MNKGYLSEYFTGVGTKVLTRVDATRKSNQHEIGDNQNGAALKHILGDQPRKQSNPFNATYIWLFDEQEAITESGFLSWYDTRENQPHRKPEWRLYYRTNKVTELMNQGDRLFIARQDNDNILFIVIPADSHIQNHVAWLFGLLEQPEIGFTAQEITSHNDQKLDFISRLVLDEIGIEFEDPEANTLDAIIDQFGMVFPKTIEFSALARLTLPEVDVIDDPDAALLAWLNHEEAMFRRLEKKIVAERVAQGFSDEGGVDVDEFIKYSLSVHNRRKSRMGHSFENHLKAILENHNIRFDRQVITEKGKRPDFIFPGKAEYDDPQFNLELLTMLAAKSTCKDRWPQILPEAEKITKKHLLTLELAISEPQTDTMKESNIQLIVPRRIQSSYNKDQQNWLWSVKDFVQLVSERQSLAAK